MRPKFVLGLILMVAVAFYAYSWEVARLTTVVGATAPTGIVDAIGVKLDLLQIANAEQQQFALESKYLPLDQLRARGVRVPERRGPYVFSADVTGDTFVVRATYEMPPGGKPSADFMVGPDMQFRVAPPTPR